MVWLPMSCGPVWQTPSRTKPVIGDTLHTCSWPPNTLRASLTPASSIENKTDKK
jgi:hypothetical protein